MFIITISVEKGTTADEIKEVLEKAADDGEIGEPFELKLDED